MFKKPCVLPVVRSTVTDVAGTSFGDSESTFAWE